MDRRSWLQDIRRSTEERYDTMFAEDFDEKWGEILPAHREFMNRFLDRLPPKSHIMDAACGTGKYWQMILERGHTLMGIDQSGEMLRHARSKHPSVSVKKMGLQEMDFEESFDGITCVDAMEFIPPDDWPLVLGNFRRALMPNGPLYFTVEIGTDEEIREGFQMGKDENLPVVRGEDPREGYHYFPAYEDVTEWVEKAGFTILMKDSSGYYHHFLVLKE